MCVAFRLPHAWPEFLAEGRQATQTKGILINGTTKSISFPDRFLRRAGAFSIDPELLEDQRLLGVGQRGLAHLQDGAAVEWQDGRY